ncbi:MAG: fimbria/pilus periplasmic chaperone [Pseudomonadota bacterium]|uniref:fimbria/pilus periplasmic chaperone n=1 Tax=Providencia TaxID=586 RepID=UPI0024B20A4E
MKLTTIQRTGLVISGVFITHLATAGITMDRTRVIFEGDKKSITLNIGNNNKELPYLAQGWLENDKGQKVSSPLVVLPPVQRIEAGKSSQIKIEALPAVNTLPQDRETLFYFNLREIPPKSEKSNVLQVALQTRVKLFYRPKAIIPGEQSSPWQEKITIDKSAQMAMVKNPTPFYVTIINAHSLTYQTKNNDFSPVMVSPFGQASLGITSAKLGDKPSLIYINDYGGRPELEFSCKANVCNVTKTKP